MTSQLHTVHLGRSQRAERERERGTAITFKTSACDTCLNSSHDFLILLFHSPNLPALSIFRAVSSVADGKENFPCFLPPKMKKKSGFGGRKFWPLRAPVALLPRGSIGVVGRGQQWEWTEVDRRGWCDEGPLVGRQHYLRIFNIPTPICGSRPDVADSLGSSHV